MGSRRSLRLFPQRDGLQDAGQRGRRTKKGGTLKSVPPEITSDIEQAKDVFGQDHEDQVDDPDDVPTENNADESCDDLSFQKTGHESANEGSDGYDREDNAQEVV